MSRQASALLIHASRHNDYDEAVRLLDCGANLHADDGRGPGAPLRADALVQLLLDADAIGLASQASRHDAVDALETAEDAAKAKAKNRWQRMLKPAILAGKSTQDPWREFEVHKRKTELCVRHDYDAKHDKWHTSETLVKMEDAPFAHGAMRECYRMKKMSQARHSCGRPSCGGAILGRAIRAQFADARVNSIPYLRR